MLTFLYGHKGRHLSVRVQSSQIYCTGTQASHVQDGKVDIQSDSSYLCHCLVLHPTTQVLVNQMCSEAVELAALHTQDELSSVPPFPL